MITIRTVTSSGQHELSSKCLHLVGLLGMPFLQATREVVVVVPDALVQLLWNLINGLDATLRVVLESSCVLRAMP